VISKKLLRSGMGKAVLVAGLPGAGKSTLGRSLSGALGWRFYDFDHSMPEDFKFKIQSGLVLSAEERKTFLQQVIRDLMAMNEMNVVVVCVLLKDEDRMLISNIFDGTVYVELKCPLEELRRRIALRNNSFFRLETFNALNNLNTPVGIPHIELDSTKLDLLDTLLKAEQHFLYS